MNKENKSENEPSMEEILASIRRIISDDEKKEATSSLKKSVSSNVVNKESFESTEYASGEETLVEKLAREVMRPMIKEWLDNNLPQLVERAVRREIERLSELSKSNQ